MDIFLFYLSCFDLYANQSVEKADRLMKEKVEWTHLRFKNKTYNWPVLITRQPTKGKPLFMVKYYEDGQLDQYSFKMNLIEKFVSKLITMI